VSKAEWRTDTINILKNGSRIRVLLSSGEEVEAYYHDDLCRWIDANTGEQLPEIPKKFR